MIRRLIVLTLLLSCAVLAQDYVIDFKDEYNNAVNNTMITLYYENKTSKLYLKDTLSLSLPDYAVTFTVDLPSTPGIDYYAYEHVNAHQTVYLQSVGTVRGIVKDQLDNVIDSADIEYACKEREVSKTSRFGVFSNKHLPAGPCTITARYENAIGQYQLNLEQGSVNTIEIKLDKTIVSQDNANWLPTIIVLVIAASLALIIFKVKSLKPRAQNATVTKKTQNLSEKGRAVYNTLNGKEKLVVDYLLSNLNQGIQSHIHKQTRIPKSSLFRTIESLEQKGIVTSSREGKARKISLTPNLN